MKRQSILLVLLPTLILMWLSCGDVRYSSVKPTSIPYPTPTSLVAPDPTATSVPPDTNGVSVITMPEFAFTDKSGSKVSLSTMLVHNRFVVLVFYRGHF